MKQILLIRIALVLGVTVFAGITLFLRTQGHLPAPDGRLQAQLQYFRYATWAVAALALVWALVSKARAEAAMTEAGMHRALILGWAPGEAATLLGTATYFLGGPVASMAFGLLTFIVVLLILRVPTPPR